MGNLRIVSNVELNSSNYVGDLDVIRMKQAMIARKGDIKKSGGQKKKLPIRYLLRPPSSAVKCISTLFKYKLGLSIITSFDDQKWQDICFVSIFI